MSAIEPAWRSEIRTEDVLVEVLAERTRQTAKHGDQSHLPMGTGPATFLRDLPGYQGHARADHMEAWARDRCQAASEDAGDATITFEMILTEEWGEVIAEQDPRRLRAELVQLAAVAVQMIEALDRRADRPCTRCEGCGRVADSDDGEPWTAWEQLPPGSDVAVRLGLVSPLPCPECSGTGRVAGGAR